MKAKVLWVVLLSSFTGMILNPGILAASDSVKISDLDGAGIVETKEVKTPKEKVSNSVVKTTTLVEPKTEKPTEVKAAAETKVATEKKVVEEAPVNQIKFSWGTQKLVKSSSTNTEAGNNVVKVGRLIYGHNYTSFKQITNLKLGDTFSVTENGVTKKYKVAANPIDSKAGVVLKVNGNAMYHDKVGAIYTNALTDLGFGGHDLVLLTCYGQNNSGRYVVVADEF